MITAQDFAGKTNGVAAQPSMAFGIGSPAAHAATLRRMADLVQAGAMRITEVTGGSEATGDDFTVHFLTIEFVVPEPAQQS